MERSLPLELKSQEKFKNSIRILDHIEIWPGQGESAREGSSPRAPSLCAGVYGRDMDGTDTAMAVRVWIWG